MKLKTFKVIAAILLSVAIVFVSMGYLTFRRSDSLKDVLFSTDNVVRDLNTISSRYHSVLHPSGREFVRLYLCDRLRALGGAPEVLEYDSIPSKFGGTMDIADIYCRFDPEGKDALPDSYVMLVAHMDSRFPEETPDGTVCSYGAADDGYGLGVILELARGALSYAREWNQGLKILFTDAEEHELDGVRCALEQDRHVFDGVGLVVNVEARGVKGPCLLFETSDGNSRLMDFYVDNAVYPYTYSLTSAVYRLMPNFTDFTHLKPLFPGYNFSVIDNLHYYHNDRDNFSNIHPESISHYGAQLEPMLREFLTGEKYADPEYFLSDSDMIVFSVPGLGTFRLGQVGNFIFNAVVLVLFVMAFVLYLAFGRIRVRNVLANAFWLLLSGILLAAAGTGVVFCVTRLAGLPFSFTSVKYLDSDWIIAAAALAATAAGYLYFFIRKSRRSENFVFEHLFGMLLSVLILSGVLLFTIGENFFLMFPAACVLVALLLHVFVYMNIMSLPASLLVEMVALPFLYNLYTALTVGSLGLVMFLMFIYLVMITSLVRCYMAQKR